MTTSTPTAEFVRDTNNQSLLVIEDMTNSESAVDDPKYTQLMGRYDMFLHVHIAKAGAHNHGFLYFKHQHPRKPRGLLIRYIDEDVYVAYEDIPGFPRMAHQYYHDTFPSLQLLISHRFNDYPPIVNAKMTKAGEVDSTKKEVDYEISEGISPNKGVLYGITDNPSVGLCFLFGLQHAIMTIGGVLSIPFILSNLLCAGDRPDVTSRLLSITMFMCGVATVIQAVFGIRLGIIQGGSHTFVAPIVAMMSVAKWQCPDTDATVTTNETLHDTDPNIWKDRMREIQGNLILASMTQLFLGCSGLLGFLLQFIGPLTIAPTISLIGLSLTSVAIGFNKVHWGVAFFAMVFIVIFSLYLRAVKVPLPLWRDGGCRIEGFQLFQLFPVILNIGLSWILCHILTISDTIPNNSTHPNFLARTDARTFVVDDAPWLYWPYPFQFGIPSFSAAGYIGFLAATLSSVIESVGDYHAAARISGAAPPPAHAVNRGIAIEGLASVISGMVGAGHGTTSYSGNIGAIGITKVASRRVFITAGIILIVCGVIGKFGAILSLIPDPVIGGTLSVVFGIVSAVGISTLKFIDMDSTRNLTILGLSLLLGLMVPQYVNDPSNADSIKTGNEELDQIIKVMCGTAMFVGGLVGFILDNTVPGSPKERGIYSWRENESTNLEDLDGTDIYEYPYMMKYIRRVKCCSYFPVSPTFDREIKIRKPTCCKTKNYSTSYTTSADPIQTELEMKPETNGIYNVTIETE